MTVEKMNFVLKLLLWRVTVKFVPFMMPKGTIAQLIITGLSRVALKNVLIAEVMKVSKSTDTN